MGKLLIPLLFTLSAIPPAAHAATMLFTVPPNSSIPGQGNVSGTALFTTSANTLTIVLTNTYSNPTSDGQAISGLQFGFVPAVGGLTLASDTGTEISISNKVGTPSSTVVSAGWGLYSFNSQSIVCIICPAGDTPPGHTAPPDHLIIGPGPYTNSNASTNQHSPYMDQSVTFTFSSSDITAQTLISDVTFRFTTTFGSGTALTGSVPGVPEPSALLLCLPGMAALVLYRRRHRADSPQLP